MLRILIAAGISLAVAVGAAADGPEIDATGMEATASGYCLFTGGCQPWRALDDDLDSAWSPHHSSGWLRIDMRARRVLGSVDIQGQPGIDDNRVKDYRIHVTDSETEWGEEVASGTLPNDPDRHKITFEPTAGRYLVVEALTPYGTRPTVARLRLFGPSRTYVSEFSVPGGALFTSTGNVAVTLAGQPVAPAKSITGYMIAETPDSPTPETRGWRAKITSHRIKSPEGFVTLYAWALDDQKTVAGSRITVLYNSVKPKVTSTVLAPVAADAARLTLTASTIACARARYHGGAGWRYTDWTKAGTEHELLLTGLSIGKSCAVTIEANDAKVKPATYNHLADTPGIVADSLLVKAEYLATLVEWTSASPGVGQVAWGLDPVNLENTSEFGPYGTRHRFVLTGPKAGPMNYLAVRCNAGAFGKPVPFTVPAADYVNNFSASTDDWRKIAWAQGEPSPDGSLAITGDQLRRRSPADGGVPIGTSGRLRTTKPADGGIIAHYRWAGIAGGRSLTGLIDVSAVHVYSPHGFRAEWHVAIIGNGGRGLMLTAYQGSGWKLWRYEAMSELYTTGLYSCKAAADPNRRLWTGQTGKQPDGGWEHFERTQTVKVFVDATNVQVITYFRDDPSTVVEDSGVIPHGIANLTSAAFGAGTSDRSGAWADFDNAIILGTFCDPPAVTAFDAVGQDTGLKEVSGDLALKVTRFEAYDTDGTV